MENNLRKNALQSGYIGLVTLFLMLGLLYTPFFEFGEYKVSSNDYYNRENPYPVYFKSDVYPIPFTDMYNVRTHDGWSFLDLSNTDTKDITFPKNKGFNIVEYSKKYGDMRIYVRRIDHGSFGYFLLFSLMVSITMFISLTLYDYALKYMEGRNKSKEDDLSEYTLLR